jgi:hypothetical protein
MTNAKYKESNGLLTTEVDSLKKIKADLEMLIKRLDVLEEKSESIARNQKNR